MAVSANLNVSDELKEVFLGAQDGSLRYLIVRIKAEVLTLAGKHASTDNEEEDFGTIVDQVAQHEPSFVLFHRQVDEDADARPWVLISYVPDTSKVRQKMLYASSKKDLLKQLGESLFADEDFYVGEEADLTFEGLVHATRKATEAERQSVLTAAEQAVHDEASEAVVMSAPPTSGGGGGGGGGAVPFQFDDDAMEALKAFSAGDRQCVEIKIHPKKERCMLGDLAGDTAQGDLQSHINEEEPRFYLINYGKKVFVYCCPENSKVRSRMLYSTCRATVISNAREVGIDFEKTAEMRQANEIGDCLTVETAEAAQAVKEVTKVTRKTRGKRRLNKKISWT